MHSTNGLHTLARTRRLFRSFQHYQLPCRAIHHQRQTTVASLRHWLQTRFHLSQEKVSSQSLPPHRSRLSGGRGGTSRWGLRRRPGQDAWPRRCDRAEARWRTWSGWTTHWTGRLRRGGTIRHWSCWDATGRRRLPSPGSRRRRSRTSVQTRGCLFVWRSEMVDRLPSYHHTTYQHSDPHSTTTTTSTIISIPFLGSETNLSRQRPRLRFNDPRRRPRSRPWSKNKTRASV